MEKWCEPAPMHIIEKLKLRNKVHAPVHKLWMCAGTLDNEPEESRHLRKDKKSSEDGRNPVRIERVESEVIL